MKTLQFYGNSKVGFKEIPKPVCGEETVIIKVKASALCGSELGSFKGKPLQVHNTGHEVVGIIEEAPVGSVYKREMRVGARVVQGCGKCEFCKQKYETACRSSIFYSNGHAEYFKLGVNGIQPIPDDVDWPTATILTGDGLGVPVRCARRLGNTKGKKILILGLGPVGLSCALVQVFKGAEVMGADTYQYRVDFSRKLGALKSVNIKTQNLKEEVTKWTVWKGADIVILAAGSNEALLNAIELVKQQGIVYHVADFSEATINPSAAFVHKEITMTGSLYYTSADWEEMLALHRAGLPYGKLVTHVFPFEQAQKAFDIFVSGNTGKVVLTYV